MQELTGRPFMRTVQAPQSPSSHPFFVPVRFRWFRRMRCCRVVFGLTATDVRLAVDLEPDD